MDGRDIGTVILPDAELKIFLTASPEARAKRRYDELCARGVKTSYEAVYDEIVKRDRNDSTRDIAPCVQADDAILLDNSNMTPDQTTEAVLKMVKKITKNKTGYMKLHVFLAPFFRFVMRLKPKNLEQVPLDGGLIICSNHIHALDVLSIAATSPRQISFIAKKELFSIPILSWIIKKLGAVKINRDGNDVKAIKTSIALAESGKVISIFPQGHRYPGVDPKTTPIKHGAAMIAYHSKCDVLPVYISSKDAKYRFLRKIDVIYGEVIKYDDLGFTVGGRDEYEKASEIIYNKILSLGDQHDLPIYEDKAKRV